MKEIDPWGNALVDYQKLFTQFGLQTLSPAMKKRFSSHRGFRRDIVFAHRGLESFIKTADDGKPVAVMTGIKPSNSFHLGSKLTAEELILLQKEFNAKAFYGIADLEAYADNGLPLEQSHEIAIDNVADLLALGLHEKNAFIYKQSRNAEVMRLAQLFAKRTTTATLEALYGKQNLGLYFSVLTQAGDILFPMLEENGGARAVVVPVGADQDPHIRLTRDLAAKFAAEKGFEPPSATYHKFFRALDGTTKMSKRDPQNILSLNDSEKEVKKKVSNALTGGRDTTEEQRKKGGQPEKCVVYELMQFHFYDDDKDLKDMKEDCTSGRLLCGECKLQRIAHINEYLKKHQEKKKAKLAKAEKIIETVSNPRS
ncbi:tryptophan--tRNA ligase [Candidatus Micrarchaeota archaeon]|nr:tryptophan--tRNA ligase [Candidatus Micrarchaeota archaeon]